MTVGMLLAYLRPFYPTWDRALEAAMIQQFNLPLDRKLRQLSRGMRMKAALAGSLAYHPKLIVLDEPFTGLDPLVRDELIQGLLERAEESTIFVSFQTWRTSKTLPVMSPISAKANSVSPKNFSSSTALPRS